MNLYIVVLNVNYQVNNLFEIVFGGGEDLSDDMPSPTPVTLEFDYKLLLELKESGKQHTLDSISYKK